MSYQDCKFTWSNKRDVNSVVEVRLERRDLIFLKLKIFPEQVPIKALYWLQWT